MAQNQAMRLFWIWYFSVGSVLFLACLVAVFRDPDNILTREMHRTDIGSPVTVRTVLGILLLAAFAWMTFPLLALTHFYLTLREFYIFWKTERAAR